MILIFQLPPPQFIFHIPTLPLIEIKGIQCRWVSAFLMTKYPRDERVQVQSKLYCKIGNQQCACVRPPHQMLVKLNHVKLTRKFSNVYFQTFQMHTKFPSNSKWSEWWHLGGWVSHLVSSHFLLVALDYSPASLSRLSISFEGIRLVRVPSILCIYPPFYCIIIIKTKMSQ